MSTTERADIFKEVIKQGGVVTLLIAIVYFLYNQNLAHQERIEKRLDLVEEQMTNCARENTQLRVEMTEMARNQIDKNNTFLQEIKEYVTRNRR